MDTAGGTAYDAVVVGAGVVGASVALELARGGRRVLVVDKAGAPGLGSTSASMAVVRFSYSTHEGVALSWESRHGWEDWPGHLRLPPEGLARFRRVGGLQLDVPGGHHERVLAHFDRLGIPYQRWSPDEVRRRLPALDPGRHHPPKPVVDDAFWADPDGEVGGFWCPDAGYVDDPAQAAQDLARAAQQHGVAFRFGVRVTDVPRTGERTGERVDGVALSTGEHVRAPVVVNAAGPWSAQLNALAGVLDDLAVTTRPLRQEVHAVPLPAGMPADGPFVADADLGTYCRPSGGGQLYVGGLEPECDPLHWLADPDAVDPSPTTAVFEAQVLRAARRMPGLQVPGRPKGIVGVYDVTEDWTPVYDRSALPGYYLACGTSGNQFKNAPTVGLLLRTLIDACEDGHDHDADPVTVRLPRTGLDLRLGAFSRRRPLHAESSFSVLG